MNKKITIVALVALMLLTAALPASAAIQATSVEIRGEVYDGNATSHYPMVGTETGWDAFNFAGFWYDLKDGLQSEKMVISSTINASLANNGRTIDSKNLYYNSTMRRVQYKVNEANRSNTVDHGLTSTGTKVTDTSGTHYGKLGWFAEPYVALNGKPNKLAKLLIEQGSSSSEKKTLTVGETWDIGGGWTLSAQSIDAKATPRQAWLVLSKDGVKKDDKVIAQGQVYTYVEKSIAGESDVPIFVTYIDSVFAGATSDMLQLRYTWAVDTIVTQVKSADKYGVLKVIDEGTGSDLTIKTWNEDSSISLSSDSTVDIAGNMKFKVADNSSSLRFYPMVEYEIKGVTPTGTPSATPGVGTPGKTPGVNETLVKPPVNATAAAAAVTTAAAAATTKAKGEPGFEAIYAIAGLLAVAFLVLRQRK